jgi:zinc protease
MVARFGGIGNGVTALDYTTLFATVPATHVVATLRLLGERMAMPPWEAARVDIERAIIEVEQARAANAVPWQVRTAMRATAFQVHPYRFPVLGTPPDLAAITPAALMEHYQTYYKPNNATLVLVGAVDTDRLLHQITPMLGELPSGPAPVPLDIREPPQQQERRVVLEQPHPIAYIQIGYHAPPCRHPDFAALLLLDAVLSGAKPISFSIAATQQYSGRLSQTVLATGLANGVSSRYTATHDPWLFELTATVQAGQTPDAVERALTQTIAVIQQDGVTEMERDRACRQLHAQLAYAREGLRSQAWLLGMWAMLDAFMRADTLDTMLAAVTCRDLQRVAQTYLTENRRTVACISAT